MSNWAVFIDRDGTINVDVGHLDKPEKIQIIPRTAEAIKVLNKAGAKVIVVSNQSGVALGLLSVKTVRMINRRLKKRLMSQGALIDALYFCPHHPEIGKYPYRIDCQCRKPKPGLLLQAAAEQNIDLSRSYMIGDRESDIEAGAYAGCSTILVLTGEGRQVLQNQKKLSVSSDYIAKDFYEAAQWIIRKSLVKRKKR